MTDDTIDQGAAGNTGRLVMAVNQARLRVVVLHGAHGGPDTNWFPWLHSALESQGLEVVRPRLPTPQGQSLAAWLRCL